MAWPKGSTAEQGRETGPQSTLRVGDRQAAWVSRLGGGGSGEASQPRQGANSGSGSATARADLTAASLGRIAQVLLPQLGAHAPASQPAPSIRGLEHPSQWLCGVPSALAATAMWAITLVAWATCKLVPTAKKKAMRRAADRRPCPSFVHMRTRKIRARAG
jgi:hypothetical protein